MAAPNSSTARSSPRRAAHAYAPPTPLEDLHILDVLELAGSQAKAGIALAMHQSTVCRSLQLMQSQFRLTPQQGAAVCRHGHNRCLHHLRLAYREHRLMAGLLRIGTDLLHHSLLTSIARIQQVPPQFRSGEHWAQLLQHGLLDGAIVTSFSLEQVQPAGLAPQWDGLTALPLGELTLQLVATSPSTRQVLLPRKASLPLLHQVLHWHGYELERQPAACQEQAAWIKRARDRKLALPVCRPLLAANWLARHGLEPLPQQPTLREQLWLLLPRAVAEQPVARRCLRRLRLQMMKFKTMQDLHSF